MSARRLTNVLAAIALVATALVFGPTAPVRAASPSPAPAHLSDYWEGNAEWRLYAYYAKSQYALGGDDGGFGAGTTIRVGPDGNWYWFTRTNKTPGNDCTEQAAVPGTIVRKSTDRGKTWSAPKDVVMPRAATPWACDATDGDGIWDGSHWHYLFQCRTHAGDLERKGPFFNVCHVMNDNPDPTAGTWYPDTVNPVMGDYFGGYDPWRSICDDPADDCVSMVNGNKQAVNQPGTPTIFTVSTDPGWYYVDFHGIDQNNGAFQRGFQFVGIARTRDFRTFEAKGPNLPADAVFDAKDTLGWREPTGAWPQTTIGGGGGSIFEDPSDGRFYHLVEASNGGYPFACFDATAMDVGILRSSSLTSTTWEQPNLAGRENPIFYSQENVSEDYPVPRCTPSYEGFFVDPATGETFITFLKRTAEDDTREGVYVYRLERQLLKNGDAWRCVDTSPWTVTTPGADPAANFAVWRDGNYASDGGCYFATNVDIAQTVPLPADRTYTEVSWGGKLAARASTFSPPRGFGSLPGSGAARLTLTQVSALGVVLSTEVIDVRLPPENNGTYTPLPASRTTSLDPATATLGYSLTINPPNPLLTVFADEMFIAPVEPGGSGPAPVVPELSWLPLAPLAAGGLAVLVVRRTRLRARPRG